MTESSKSSLFDYSVEIKILMANFTKFIIADSITEFNVNDSS